MHALPPRWRGWRPASPGVLAGALLSLAALAPVAAQAACGAATATATATTPMLMHVERMPDLKGCTLDEARRLLVVRKLRLATATKEKATATALIETQAPGAGDGYPPNRLVTVTLATDAAATPPATASTTERPTDIVPKRQIPNSDPKPKRLWPPGRTTALFGATLVALVVAIGVVIGTLHRGRVRRRWTQALRFAATVEGPAAARCGPLAPAAPPVGITVHLEPGHSRVGALPITVTRN